MKTAVVRSLAVLAVVSTLTGCVSPNGNPDYTGSGALIGGASGAGIGAIADRSNPGAGALIGGAAGLITGGLIGHAMDRQAEAQRERDAAAAAAAAPPPAGPPPSIADIEAMTKAGVSDEAIINQIDNTHAVYNLDANTIIELTKAGVSQKVISYMISTSSKTMVSQAPPPPPSDTVVVAAPGPDYVWVGGSWVWSGGSWVWIRGRWALPPHRHAIWIGPRWVRGRHGWYHVRGYWR